MRATPVVLALGLLLAAPATASADVIFDPADADDLAAVLAEAYTDQDVCYGWQVTVNDVASISESVGSNFGAGKPVTSGTCQATVEFTATITYTSESSESEDSASYGVTSNPPGVTQTDLDALGLDFDALTGEDPDVVIGKAVTALPLLAADEGIAQPLSAAPETATAPADAQLTDDPGSDWWRGRGGMVIWALVLMAASGVLIWAVLKTSRRRPSRKAAAVEVPSHVPDSLVTDSTWAKPEQTGPEQARPEQAGPEHDTASVAEPPTEPFPASRTTSDAVAAPVVAEPPTEPFPAAGPAERKAEETEAGERKAEEPESAGPGDAKPGSESAEPGDAKPEPKVAESGATGSSAEAPSADGLEAAQPQPAEPGSNASSPEAPTPEAAAEPAEAQKPTSTPEQRKPTPTSPADPAAPTDLPNTTNPTQPAKSTVDEKPGTPEQARPAPSDQKDKE